MHGSKTWQMASLCCEALVSYLRAVTCSPRRLTRPLSSEATCRGIYRLSTIEATTTLKTLLAISSCVVLLNGAIVVPYDGKPRVDCWPDCGYPCPRHHPGRSRDCPPARQRRPAAAPNRTWIGRKQAGPSL